MKKMNDKDNKMLVRETERAIQFRNELKSKEDELHTLQKDIEKARWRRDVLRLRRNIEEYAENIFTWKEEFLDSDVGKQLCEIGEGFVWLRQHPRQYCKLHQDGTLEVILVQHSVRHFRSEKSTHVAKTIEDVTKTAIEPCGKDDVNVARLYEELSLEISCGKIFDVILNNYREGPVFTEYY